MISQNLAIKKIKRHEEQYKFISKRYLKYLKQVKKLQINFLIENFEIYFEKKFPN